MVASRCAGCLLVLGLELPRRGNTISGTPTAAGTFTFTFTVQVTDERGTTAEKEFTITVS